MNRNVSLGKLLVSGILLISSLAWPVLTAGLCGEELGATASFPADYEVSTTSRADDRASDESQDRVAFESHVRPILKTHCFMCHGEEPEKSGELDLRLVRLMLAGGDSGPAISPGSLDQSELWQRLDSDEMPPGPKKLSPEEKQILAQWIQQGATTLRPEPEDPHEARFTEEERQHWAFQPIRAPVVPEVSENLSDLSPLDRFVHAKFQEHGLSFAPMADRRTLIRRLSFNLTGLPPTPEEVEQFVNDPAPTAYADLVERLLNSPQYGVRWARHWLDVAGYAESEGQVVNDRHRPYAWRYRDYVVDALNRDLPYSQFLVEQLAGDQLIGGTPDPNDDEHARLLAATGFLYLAPDITQTENSLLNRNQAVADTLQTVTSSILGLTVACAQCHDHRYDPITIEDYYRLRAVFEPAMPLHQWRQPSARMIDMTNDDTKAERARIEAEAVSLQEDINARRRSHCQTIQDREINAAPEEVRDALRQAVLTPAAEQTAEQKSLLETYPKVRTIDWIVGQLVEYDGPAHRAFQEEELKVAAIRETKPVDRLIMAAQDFMPEAETFVLFRGDPQSPTDAVQPGEIEVIRSLRENGHDPEVLEPTQRRLAYAQQLTDASHPLVARVMVNRVWLHHFGRGLVPTPGDFGLNGQPPSHPELLDYLAHEFMEHGWSLKHLHRLILASRTFQQSAQATPTEDVENQLLGRMNLRRLDAESLRDAVLVVSGQINLQLEGPSVPVAENDEGKAVIGTRILRDGLYAGIKDAGSEANRRSLYLSSQRSLQLNLLQTFDLPEMKPNCQQRSSSTVTPQSLLFMNDAWLVAAAEQTASRLWEQNITSDSRIQSLFQSLFSQPATDEELALCRSFLEQQSMVFAEYADPAWQQKLQEQPDANQQRALASLCQMLLASNRFLYLE